MSCALRIIFNILGPEVTDSTERPYILPNASVLYSYSWYNCGKTVPIFHKQTEDNVV